MVILMLNKKKENLSEIARYLPEKLKNALLSLKKEADDLCEIRLRAGKPVVLVLINGKCFFTKGGRLTSIYSSDSMKTDSHEITSIFEKMCNYSVYSFKHNICDGFITLENGCRVGVYGTAVLNDGKISSVRNIKGMNIRIAGVHIGVADRLLPLFNGFCPNVLICGPPGCGKTTVLRELVMKISDNLGFKTALIDERYEFDNYYLGFNTDVLSGYPKSQGIQISVRTLSPEVIICDEIGDADEIESVISGMNSGVAFILSIHCRNCDDLLNKKQFRMLAKAGAVDYVVFLGEKTGVSEIYHIKELWNAFDVTDSHRDDICSCGKIRCLRYDVKSACVGEG